MIASNVAKATALAALISLPLQAQAIEIVGGSAARAGDAMAQPVQYRPHVHPGYRPGVHPGYRPGYHPGYRPGYHPGYRPPVAGYRPGAVVVAPRGVWAGRPGWYGWAPGGAIAAGAAIGVLTAAAVTWAAPPQPGLCWYYTDPSRTQGFWDACP
jgi:hypothetical protein